MLVESTYTHKYLHPEGSGEYLKLTLWVEACTDLKKPQFYNWTDPRRLSQERLDQIIAGVASVLPKDMTHGFRVALVECRYMDTTPDDIFKKVAQVCIMDGVKQIRAAP